ncbi:unnamed protein product [Orchesella dallaii]|uniref:Uncharacterized protein n=1 Tax=Orchesella dallaii TaxID=48710 RepID=A0ABP1S7U7_9HEXA
MLNLYAVLLLPFLAVLSQKGTGSIIYKCPNPSSWNGTSNWTIPPGLLINLNMSSSHESIVFDLKEKDHFSCHFHSQIDSSQIHEFYWHSEQTQLKINRNGVSLTVNKSNLSLLQDGTLVWNKDEWERYAYEAHEFCIARLSSDGWLMFKVCADNCSVIGTASSSSSSSLLETEGPKCMRKCCPPRQIPNEDPQMNMKCVKGWWNNTSLLYWHFHTNEYTAIRFGFPNCPNPKRILADYKSSWKHRLQLLENGTLVYHIPLFGLIDYEEIYFNDYCLDGLTDSSETQIIWCGDTENEVITKLLDWEKNPFIQICNVVSVLSLFATLVLLAKWPYKGKIQNWLRLLYVSTILSAILPMTIYKLWSSSRPKVTSDYSWRTLDLCVIAAWPTMSFFFVAYCCITTLVYDLWWRVSPSKVRMDRDWIQTVVCSLFTFGGSIVILANTIGNSQLVRVDENWCFTDLKLLNAPPLYFLAGILVTINIILVIWTKVNLGKVKEVTDSKRLKEEVQMCFSTNWKLLLLMGLLHFSELAFEFSLKMTPFENTELLLWIFSPIDALRGLVGVFVFLIYFTCKITMVNISVNSNSHVETVNVDVAADAGILMTSDQACVINAFFSSD